MIEKGDWYVLLDCISHLNTVNNAACPSLFDQDVIFIVIIPWPRHSIIVAKRVPAFRTANENVLTGTGTVSIYAFNTILVVACLMGGAPR